MKKSLVTFSRGIIASKRAALRSASSFGADALRLGRERDRLAVLVGAGEEEDLLTALTHVPREHVGGDRRVRVPEVGLRVDVVDRSCDVIGHAAENSSGRRAEVAMRRAGRYCATIFFVAFFSSRTALRYSRLSVPITSIEISCGHASEHSPKLVQPPKPSSSI